MIMTSAPLSLDRARPTPPPRPLQRPTADTPISPAFQTQPKSTPPTLRALRKAFQNQQNISEMLRHQQNRIENDAEIIEIAYDVQAGSYVSLQATPERQRFQAAYAGALVSVIDALGPCRSLFEGGVGEATTLAPVLRGWGGELPTAAGIDLCWSRIRWAKRWLHQNGAASVFLASAALDRLPFPDNAFDIVYTSHSLEPNRGREQLLIRELHRIAARYVVLLEPSYELATAEGRQRMDRHGYVRDIPGHAKRLGLRVIEHSRFPFTHRESNPTAITVIEKDRRAMATDSRPVCPACHSQLQPTDGFLFCAEGCGRAYPVLHGIPCLRVEKGIIASQLFDFPVA